MIARIKSYSSPRVILIFILLSSFFLFLPSLRQFFSADDWTFLRISQIETLPEFVNFFRFDETPQRATFYRPLSTQVMFFLNLQVFGLQSHWWYLQLLVLFMGVLILYYALLKKFTSTKIALLSVLLYAWSQTNFSRLYFISSFQEIWLVVWSLLCALAFFGSKKPRNYMLSIIFFVCALLSKETAIVLPLGLCLLWVWQTTSQEKNLKKILSFSTHKLFLKKMLPFLILSAVYLYFRFLVFGLDHTSAQDTYAWNFSPIEATKTLTWYSLWSLGAPETLLNYLNLPFHLLPRFFTDFPLYGSPIIALLVLSFCLVVGLVGNLLRELWLSRAQVKNWYQALSRHGVWHLLFGGAWFVLTLGPVLFLPEHKYALELGLPLMGSSLALAFLVAKSRKLGVVFLLVYIALNWSSIKISERSHYTVLRSQIAQKVYAYFTAVYPSSLPPNAYVLFTNDVTGLPVTWGVSKQISEALLGDEFFRVVYPHSDVQVFYEDFDSTYPDDRRAIVLGSQVFLQPPQN